VRRSHRGETTRITTPGFRPMRSTAECDCAGIKLLSRKSAPGWVLEGDIVGCFDHIIHVL